MDPLVDRQRLGVLALPAVRHPKIPGTVESLGVILAQMLGLHVQNVPLQLLRFRIPPCEPPRAPCLSQTQEGARGN